MPAGDAADRGLAARSTGMGSGQAGIEAALVEADEVVGINPADHLGAPRRPRGGDIGALLLARAKRLFRAAARHAAAPGTAMRG